MRKLQIAAISLAMVALVSYMASAQKVKITQLMMPHHLGFTQEYYEAMAQRFEAVHPNVEIEVVAAASRPDYEEKVVVGSAAGVIFDVMVPPALVWAKLAGGGFFVDLNPYLEKDNEVDRDDFLEISLIAQTLNNQLLGLPLGISTIATNSNVQMFQEAGMVTPLQLGDGWNWDAMLEIGRKMAKDVNGDGQNDEFGLFSGLGYSRLVPLFVHNAGGDVLDAQVDPRRSTFTTDPAVEIGLNYFLELVDRNYITWGGSRYRDGAIGVHLTTLPEESITFIRDFGKPFEFEVAPNPRGPERQGSEVLAFSYNIHKDSPHKDMSWEWIKFLATDRESVRGVMKAWGNPTPYKPYLLDYFELFPEAPSSFIVYGDILQSPDARVQPVTPAYVEIQRIFDGRFRQVLDGQESLNNFLVNMDILIQAELDKVWAE